jgi:hypothetical protein
MHIIGLTMYQIVRLMLRDVVVATRRQLHFIVIGDLSPAHFMEGRPESLHEGWISKLGIKLRLIPVISRGHWRGC